MINCPSCGKPMILRNGEYGEFYGCLDYPRCQQTLNVDDVEDVCFDSDSGSSMFDACRADGFTYSESTEIAREWERQEENDHWK